MKEDVANIRTAVSEAITNKDARQSAISEILSSLKAIWAKITESGIIGAVIEKVQGFISSVTRSGDEGTPLLEGGVSSRVASLPGTGGLIEKVVSVLPERIKKQIAGAVANEAKPEPKEVVATAAAVAPVVKETV